MKKIVTSSIIILGIAYASLSSKKLVLIAQTLPYNLAVSWDASPDGITYNCYLDGAVVVNVSTLNCTIPINTIGNHTVTVTVLNPSFVPNESIPTSVSFTLKQPTKASNIRIK